MIPAALAAKAVGRPVKIIYTRDEDLRNDFYRSITYQRLRAGIDKQGNVVALRHDVCMASSAERAAPNLLTPSKDKGDKYKVDGSSMSGANSWYGIPNYGARDITNDLGQRATPPGFLAVGVNGVDVLRSRKLPRRSGAARPARTRSSCVCRC